MGTFKCPHTLSFKYFMKKFLPILIFAILLICCKKETINSISDKKESAIVKQEIKRGLTLTEFTKYWRNIDYPIEQVSLYLYKQGIAYYVPHVFEEPNDETILTKYITEEKKL